jgi:hypothetical protein
MAIALVECNSSSPILCLIRNFSVTFLLSHTNEIAFRSLTKFSSNNKCHIHTLFYSQHQISGGYRSLILDHKKTHTFYAIPILQVPYFLQHIPSHQTPPSIRNEHLAIYSPFSHEFPMTELILKSYRSNDVFLFPDPWWLYFHALDRRRKLQFSHDERNLLLQYVLEELSQPILSHHCRGRHVFMSVPRD